MPTKDQAGTEHHYHGSAPVALTGMVPNTDGMPNGLSPDSTQVCGPAKKPIQPTPSSDNSRLTKASRLQSIRQQHTATGVSERLQSSYWQGGAQGQMQPISRDGQDGIAGVVNGKLILFHAASSLS